MTSFQPNSDIAIGTVPWDNSYQNVRLYSTLSAQTAGISAFMDNTKHIFTYTYVRKDSAVRVQMNAELLYGYNYVAYKNTNYGDKMFYAFIVECNYINENCTELVLETDVMQTWMFDYLLMPGFVEREHVADDRIGKNLIAEPECSFNTYCYSKTEDEDFEDYGVVVQTSTTIWADNGTMSSPVTGLSMSGREYCNVYSGAKMYYWDLSDVDFGTKSLRRFLYLLNAAGSGDAISNIFMFPSEFVGTVGETVSDTTSLDYYDYFSDHAVAASSMPQYTLKNVYMPSSFFGYTPRNNKLFTYPYCFIRCEDNSGHYIDWKWELFEKFSDQDGIYARYFVQVPIDADAIAFVVPFDYNGDEETNYENSLTFPCTGKCSWQYGAYANWSAQNRLGNILSALVGGASIVAPAAAGISNAIAEGGLLGAIQNKDDMFGNKDLAVMGGGVMALGNLASNINRQSLVPNSVRGSSNGNSLLGTGKMTYNVKVMGAQRPFMEVIDQFFDRFGYQVDSLKVPDISGRPYWNYVKMKDSNHSANASARIPSDDLAAINSIYNSGVTFWHTDQLGNYSLDNRAYTR